MKKIDWICATIVLVSIAVLMLFTTAIAVHAKEPEYIAPVKIRATCYTWTGNRCATGCYPYEGIIAGRQEWSGYAAILYDADMKYIGVFELRDTGGHPTLQNGSSIDVYRDTLAECYEWVDDYGDYLYIQIIPAEG